MGYSQLFILCYMGSSLQIAYKKLERSLYGINWFLLSPNDQKIIAAALRRVQNGPLFSIGPFDVLNYETAAKVNYIF